MPIPLILLLSLLIALARGGRLSNLAHISIRYPILLFLPFAIQLIAFSPVGDIFINNILLAQILYLVSMALAIFALWLNRHLPGVLWIALGLVLNTLVITLNGGFMPVSAAARQFAGQPPLTERDMNIIPMTDATLLPWLGDILPLPAFLPFATVFSIGDVFIAIGGVIFIQKSMVLAKPRADHETE